jgi:hypothetical protein
MQPIVMPQAAVYTNKRIPINPINPMNLLQDIIRFRFILVLDCCRNRRSPVGAFRPIQVLITDPGMHSQYGFKSKSINDTQLMMVAFGVIHNLRRAKKAMKRI